MRLVFQIGRIKAAVTVKEICAIKEKHYLYPEGRKNSPEDRMKTPASKKGDSLYWMLLRASLLHNHHLERFGLVHRILCMY